MSARRVRQMPLFFIPMLYVVVMIVGGFIVPRLEHEYLAAFSHGTSVSSALATLSAIASGMIALTGVVYALAFVMVQFSAVAYSPRLVSWFSNDPLLYHALGLFTATFGYAIAALMWIDRGGNGKVPLISVLIVIALLLMSMFVFILLVRRLSDLQITNVLQTVGQKGREVIRELFPRLDTQAGEQHKSWGEAFRQAGRLPVTQTLRYSDEPRSVARFDIVALVALAKASDAVIVMECAVGDTLVEDTVLLRVHAGTRPIGEPALMQAIERAKERTFEQDPKYSLRLLVDIAIKALSPAVNDPTTAVQAIDQIEDMLRHLGRRVLDAGYASDGEGVLRVVFPTPTWDDYLALGFDEIRQFGATSVQVMRRLRSALAGLAESVTDSERAQAVQQYMRHLERTVGQSGLDADDQRMALCEDRQGIGLSRQPSSP